MIGELLSYRCSRDNPANGQTGISSRTTNFSSDNEGLSMSRSQFLSLLALVCFGLLATTVVTSSAQRVAVGGAGTDLLHMGPFLEVKGQETVPVLLSNNAALFRIFNDGQQAVRIVGGPSGNAELAKIEPGKFQFIGDTQFKIVGTEKDKVTTVFIVHLK
jgi:hypothetical protein